MVSLSSSVKAAAKKVTKEKENVAKATLGLQDWERAAGLAAHHGWAAPVVLARNAPKHSERDGDQAPDHDHDHDGAKGEGSRGLRD